MKKRILWYVGCIPILIFSIGISILSLMFGVRRRVWLPIDRFKDWSLK